MELCLKLYDVEAFEAYLIQAGYSECTIPVYLRKVKVFLTHGDMNRAEDMDYSRLKAIIENYDGQLTITLQTQMIKAAVHTYYGFCCGQMFHKRLSIKDFECTPAIDHEIGCFRKYLHEGAGLRVNTIISHCNTVAIFLCYCFEDLEFSPDKLSVNQIQTCLLKGLSHVSASSKRTMLTRIRSYLRFLEFEYGFHMDQVLRVPMTAPV